MIASLGGDAGTEAANDWFSGRIGTDTDRRPAMSCLCSACATDTGGRTMSRVELVRNHDVADGYSLDTVLPRSLSRD
jgi:hypothetical protein